MCQFNLMTRQTFTDVVSAKKTPVSAKSIFSIGCGFSGKPVSTRPVHGQFFCINLHYQFKSIVYLSFKAIFGKCQLYQLYYVLTKYII